MVSRLMASPVKTTHCNVCGVDLSTVKRYGGRCMPCYSDHITNKRRLLRERAVEYAGNKCHDCGGVFHQAVYDFHHINEDRNNKKEKTISVLCRSCSPWDKIQKEIDECVLLCSNCHRVRHFGDK